MFTLAMLATAADIFGYEFEIDGDNMIARVMLNGHYSHDVRLA